MPDVQFSPKPSSPVVKVKLPSVEESAVEMLTGKALEKGQVLHLILQVTDNGTPNLTTFKRVLVQVTNRELKGGKRRVYDTVSESLGLTPDQLRGLESQLTCSTQSNKR